MTLREPIHSWDDFDNLQVGFIHTKQKKRGEKPLFCTPAGVRTLDTLIKSQVLYQLSYGCIVFSIAGAKVRSIFDSTKLF